MTLLASNRILLERFRAGHEGALREVFRHYAPRVAASVRSGVRLIRGNEQFHFRGPSQELEVERIVLDTFSRAFMPKAREGYDGITPYGAYLCRIARNLMISEALSNRRAGELTSDGELPELDSLTPSAQECVEQKELGELVAEFLHERPAAEQAVYLERFQRGQSQDAAAAVLGLNRITIRRTEAKLKAAFIRFLSRRGALTAFAQKRGQP